MKLSPEATALFEAHKSRILELLERRPASVADLPRRWPMARPLIRHLLSELEMEGRVMVVAREWATRAAVYGINPYPRSVLPREGLRRAG
jgi:predicted Rossmann fold nucleotide-binding protein DprA/Smf involved in DNA uptake